MSNYELSYWERQALEQLQNWQPMGGGLPRSFGTVRNNRKATNGRKIQTIPLKNGGTKQIRKPSLS
jgi:hypothetical protein